MRTTKTCLIVLGLLFALGCGSEPLPKEATNSPTPPSSAPSGPGPSIVSISPVSASAKSPDIAMTITGSNFHDQSDFKHTSVAFWTTDPKNLHDHGKGLRTTFVSDTQLLVVIPGALMQNPASVKILVLTGDSMGMSDGFFGYPTSNPVNFAVTP